ncbi:Hpt domain-containing protein [Magnetospirillum fulvum]|uniref:HPt domain-containing protein n=1 Tax=Magnetospirillum fulvum MGU-K5 TaxID=1316936 RepID=S9TT55_MAGFU|nr:Hpt domain-containing protein [Magnetospirillum fulvum]EPY01710.1 hypothetical protein K678_09665 [Magnetospirillum fulvum MGU-K5]
MATLDPDALKRAEAALAAIQHRYIEWAEADYARLDAAWAACATTPDPEGAALRRLFQIAHDMKGQAATFDYQLVSDLGNRLCREIEAARADGVGSDRHVRLAALVAAIGRVIRERISGTGGAAGDALLAGIDGG